MTREWPLVGRSEELDDIARATRTAGGRARGIVLSGVAGVGKTRLAREALATCGPRDARRRWISGTASTRKLPLGVFADIASSFGPDPLRRVREVIDGLLGDRDRPVILGVDDAHHLDDLSAFAVHQLITRRLATVIVTKRSGEHAPDAITAIWKDRHLERLELQPLSLSETTTLVAEVLGGPVHSLSARRLWRYTQGNVLYLHQLLHSEVDAGRIAQHSGVWLWEGRPTLSPTLAELVEARIAQAPNAVHDVLDALAVAEPLDTALLATITDPEGVAEAETLGLIRIDSGAHPPAARIAHPLFGEARRTSSLQMSRLRGRIATELGRRSSTDPRHLVRRAMLTVDSDLAPEPDLLTAGAAAAIQLHDISLAEDLAERAVAAGAGPDAKYVHATAIAFQERGMSAEAVFADLADQASGPLRTQSAITRAMNLAIILGQPASAQRALGEALPPGDTGQAIKTALGALAEIVRGHASAAVDRASSVLANPSDSDAARIVSTWALVGALGDLGRIDEIEPVADRGYSLTERSAEASHLRFPLANFQASGYRFAGALSTLDATVTRVVGDTLDIPFKQAWHSFLTGLSAMSRGDLIDAQRLCREMLAYLGTGDDWRMLKGCGRTWLATVLGMAGRAVDARREFTAIQWLWDAPEPDACMWDIERLIADAWVCAAEGATSQAISIARDAARRESELGRTAREVWCLQIATQLGDSTVASRLAELADVVQGPRAPAAAAHAGALAAGNGDALVEASRRYEEFGDRIAAADAAAQAVVAYRGAGLRGAALTASATARRIADECGGADTPALRAATMPLPLTDRQREIIALAAQGLSNKQIAERLTMSLRSVQGHLFRASQRVGVNSRDELIAILEGP